jgi:hypothetical protein
MLIDKIDDYVESDKYSVSRILVDYMDADTVESILRGMYKAKLAEDNDAVCVWGRVLANAIHGHIIELLAK